jgi:hypothetical protein
MHKKLQKLCHEGFKHDSPLKLKRAGLVWLRCVLLNSDITAFRFRFYKHVGALLEFCGLVSVHLW